jgi:hypothetical protein
MVSLEARLNYLATIEQNIKLLAFNYLLQGIDKEFTSGENTSLTDDIYYQFIKSIIKKDKSLFCETYQKISNRLPTGDSQAPYINNDFLIFPIIIGIKLFSINPGWIFKVIDIRKNSPVTVTFKNILLENYDSKDNQFSIIITHLSIVNSALISQKMFDEFYYSVTKDTGLFERKSDFDILIALRAYDILLLHKGIPPEGEVYELQNFERRFLEIVKVIAFVIKNIFFCSVFLLIYKISLSHDQIRKFIVDFGIILGFFGVGILFGVNVNQIVQSYFRNLILLLLGYPKSRISKLYKAGNKSRIWRY